MAIAAMQRQFNVKASLEQYCITNLVTTDGLKLKIPGVEFNSRPLASWIALDYLDKNNAENFRAGDGGAPACQVEMIFQISCLLKSRSATGAPVNIRALDTLRDTVLGRFSPNTQINVYDYYSSAGTTTPVGSLCVKFAEDTPSSRWNPQLSSSNLQAVSPDDEVQAHIVTVYVEYTEPRAST